MSPTATSTVLSIVSFLCALLVLIALPWHLRALNVATVSLILWLFIMNFVNGINVLLWSGNVRDIPIWCDIVSNLNTGFNMALPASCLCICIHLERIASFRQSTTPQAKTRRVIFQVVLCFVLPMIYIVAHYIVQSRRYDIIKGYGCRPATYISLPVVFLQWAPPLVCTSATLVFASLALRHFLKQGSQVFRRTNRIPSALTPNRYLRLIGMSFLEMFWSVVFCSVNIRYSLLNAGGLHKYGSWQEVHSDFDSYQIITPDNTSKAIWGFFEFMFWVFPVSSVLFFIFFALGEEAVNEYKNIASWIMAPFRRQGSGGVELDQRKPHLATSVSISSLRTLPEFTTTTIKQVDAKSSQASISSSSPPTPPPKDTSFDLSPRFPHMHKEPLSPRPFQPRTPQSAILSETSSTHELGV